MQVRFDVQLSAAAAIAAELKAKKEEEEQERIEQEALEAIKKVEAAKDVDPAAAESEQEGPKS